MRRPFPRSRVSGGRGRAAIPCVLLLAVGILGTACDALAPRTDFTAYQMEELAALEEPRMVPEIAMGNLPPPPGATTASSVPRLIRSGSARMEVRDLDNAVAEARDLAAGVGGYLAGSEVREGREGARQATLVLRIPSDAFEPLIDDLPALGRVISISVSASDISREYMDVETRLAVQEETVGRLRALAARGGSLEDHLAAERELGRAIAELERFKGQIRYFDQRVAESDLRLTLIEPGAVIASGAFRPVVVALRESGELLGRSLALMIYAVVYLLPWAVLLGGGGFLARRWWRRRKRGRSEATA
jgi:hypothetical protein